MTASSTTGSGVAASITHGCSPVRVIKLPELCRQPLLYHRAGATTFFLVCKVVSSPYIALDAIHMIVFVRSALPIPPGRFDCLRRCHLNKQQSSGTLRTRMRFRNNLSMENFLRCCLIASSRPSSHYEGAKIAMNIRDARKDLDYAIEWNRRVFTPLGVWPLKRNASASERTAKKIRTAVSFWILFFHMIPQYLNILLSDRSIEEYLQLVAAEVFQALGVMKFFILVMNSEKIAYCLHCIEDDWLNVKLEEDRRTMYRHAKVGRYLTIYCLGFMYGGLIPYNVILPFLNEEPETKQGNHSFLQRPLSYPTTYVYFDERSTPIYEITWIIQFIGSAYVCALNSGVYTMTGVLVAHASGQLQVIGSRLEDLIDGNRKEFPGTSQRMAGIVEHHLYVIRYTKCVNNAFQMTFFTDEIGALAVICFVGYMVVTTWNDNQSTLGTMIWTTLMVATTFNIFVISYVGQQLQDKFAMPTCTHFVRTAIPISMQNVIHMVGIGIGNNSQQVGIASARVPWYRLQPTYARSLILCMARSAIPLKLSAFNMFDLSLANFGVVLRRSFVFLNMVRQMTNVE